MIVFTISGFRWAGFCLQAQSVGQSCKPEGGRPDLLRASPPAMFCSREQPLWWPVEQSEFVIVFTMLVCPGSLIWYAVAVGHTAGWLSLVLVLSQAGGSGLFKTARFPSRWVVHI